MSSEKKNAAVAMHAAYRQSIDAGVVSLRYDVVLLRA